MIIGADSHFMRRALHQAWLHAGGTWPNPTVGACLVKEGRLLAEAGHQRSGGAHAEIHVLEECREAARDATLYVTLEPCHHSGRTGPCTAAVYAAGVNRVVYALADTNPRVRGGGGEWLARQGIQVDSGLLAAQAWELNHAFFESGGGEHMHVTLKLAMSRDNRVARAEGPVEDQALRRISGERAHRRVHRMRSQMGCVLVGRRTAEFDRPRLDARGVETLHQPRPAVLDCRLELDPDLLPEGCLVLSSERADADRRRLFAASGREVIPCVESRPHRLEWESIGQALQERSLGPLLIEGGAAVANSLLEEGYPHRLVYFFAPFTVGGKGPSLEPPQDWFDRYESCRRRPCGRDQEWILRRRDIAASAPGVASKGD